MDGTPARFDILISNNPESQFFLLYSSRYIAAATPTGIAINAVNNKIQILPINAV